MGYFKNRWKIIAGILAVIAFMATIGLWVFALIPVVGTWAFIAALYIWYIPSVVFEWTGLFRIHEFGASPNGVGGYIVVIVFYFIIASVIAWPFDRGKKE